MSQAGWIASLALPVGQNLLASAIGGSVIAALLFLGGKVTGLLGCPAAVREDVRAGELLRIQEEWDQARRLMRDVLTGTPGAKCARLLAAEIEYHFMLCEKRAGNEIAAEEHRAQCFCHAKQSMPRWGSSPRAEALLIACSARTMVKI